MKAWHFWHLALVWLAAAVVLATLVVFDLKRSQAFAFQVPRGATWKFWLAAVRPLARVVPIAVGALLAVPLIVAGLTIWWIATRF